MRRPDPEELALLPAKRIAVIAGEIGSRQLARECGGVLSGAGDPDLIRWLGGVPASNADEASWHRVWALRALLYVWDESLSDLVVSFLSADPWREREGAARVVLKRELPGADLLPPLLEDPLPRVRAAGLSALGAVGEAENADAVIECLDDGDSSVVEAAGRALARMERRLDRRFR